MDVETAILTVLWEDWKKQVVKVPPDGNRLFCRYVEFGEDGGWDDWSLAALVKEADLQWLREGDEETDTAAEILLGLARGEKFGVVTSETLKLQWGLFHGDGPDGVRVSDWACS